ncbi:MAG: hypothetical protein Q9221_002826 [Calogaya cf. arnoldii]
MTDVALRQNDEVDGGSMMDLSMERNGADAFDKVNGFNLGSDHRFDAPSVPKRLPLNHLQPNDLNLSSIRFLGKLDSMVYNKGSSWHTANSQPVMHATTRGGASKGTAESSSNGRDDDDRDKDNKGKKKARDAPDPESSDDDSDEENDKPEAPKKQRRTPNRAAKEPKTPSKKGSKIGGRSFKQTGTPPPNRQTTPRAPSFSPLTNPSDQENAGTTRQRRPRLSPNSLADQALKERPLPPPGPDDTIEVWSSSSSEDQPPPPSSEEQPSSSPEDSDPPRDGDAVIETKDGNGNLTSRVRNPNPNAPRSSVLSIIDLTTTQPPDTSSSDPGASTSPPPTGPRTHRNPPVHVTDRGSPVVEEDDLAGSYPAPGHPPFTLHNDNPWSPPDSPPRILALGTAPIAPMMPNILAPVGYVPVGHPLIQAAPPPPPPPPPPPAQPAVRPRGGRRGRARGRERDARGRFVRAGEGTVRPPAGLGRLGVRVVEVGEGVGGMRGEEEGMRGEEGVGEEVGEEGGVERRLRRGGVRG